MARPPAYLPPKRLTMANEGPDFRDVAKGLNSTIRELSRMTTVLPRLIKVFERLTMVSGGMIGAAGVSRFAGGMGPGVGSFAGSALGSGGARNFGGLWGQTYRSSGSVLARNELGQFAPGGYQQIPLSPIRTGGRAILARMGGGRGTEALSALGGKGIGAIGTVGGSAVLGGTLTGIGVAMIAATVAANNWTKTMVKSMQSISSSTSLFARMKGGDVNAARERAQATMGAYAGMNPETPSGGNLMSWLGVNWAGRQARWLWGGDSEKRLNPEKRLELARVRASGAQQQLKVLEDRVPRRVEFGGYEETWNKMASQLAGDDATKLSKDQLKMLEKIERNTSRAESTILGETNALGPPEK